MTEMTALNAETDAVIFTVYTGLMAAGACQNPVSSATVLNVKIMEQRDGTIHSILRSF